MQEIAEQLNRIEGKLDRLLIAGNERRAAAAARRQHYREARERRDRGKVPLPERHVLTYRDPRLQYRVAGWVQAGLKFAAADDPEGFMRWFVHDWNTTCYLKKPVTFSGSRFHVHTGSIRLPWGASDLLGLNKKSVQRLRNDAEYVDFQNRPWWNWGNRVLAPVFDGLEESEDELPARFVKCLQLLLSGRYEVYTDVYWDRYEPIAAVNRMLGRVGPDLRSMWNACYHGLRLKESPQLPSRPLAPAAGAAGLSGAPP